MTLNSALIAATGLIYQLSLQSNWKILIFWKPGPKKEMGCPVLWHLKPRSNQPSTKHKPSIWHFFGCQKNGTIALAQESPPPVPPWGRLPVPPAARCRPTCLGDLEASGCSGIVFFFESEFWISMVYDGFKLML